MAIVMLEKKRSNGSNVIKIIAWTHHNELRNDNS